MATSSNRDVKMTLSVETLGQENIKTLQNSVASLAKEGGDAAPEFQQLADEIGRIGEQAQAIAAYKALALETSALAEKQKVASTTVTELAAKLALSGESAQLATQKQKEAAAALLTARTIYDGTVTSLKNISAEFKAGEITSEAYKSKLVSLTAAQGEQRNQFAALREALKQANAELSNAESAQSKLTAQHTRADAALTKATKALTDHNQAVNESSLAASKLGTSTDNVATSEAALLQALNASRTAALSRADAMDQVKQADTQAKAAVDAIANAFRTVGVRSAQELEAEIVQVRQAMATLKNSADLTGSQLNTAFATGEEKIKSLERQLRETNGTLTTGDKAAKLFSNSLGQISAGNIIADGVGYLVNKVKELGQAFLGAIVQGDQLKRGLNAIYKDTAITAQQIDFLRKASSESGVAFGSLSGEFVKFTASMKMANIPMEQSNALFQAVTAASSSLGLSAEATGGTLNALGQMASKGTVSMEELRAQLGDRLPGAMGLTAQGLGITESALINLVTSGQLATRDFVVPFTQALGKLKGDTDGLIPTFERFKGALAQMAQGMGDAGGTALLTGALKVLGGVMGYVTLAVSALIEGVMLGSKAFGTLTAAVVTLTNPMDTLKQLFTESIGRFLKQNEALNVAIDGYQGAATAAKGHAAAMTANTAEVTKSIAANTSLDSVQKLSALSAALAGDATLDAGTKIVQYNVASAELLKTQSTQTDAFNKLAKSAKEQGDTLIANAKLTEDSTAIQQASLQAAILHAEALDKVAKSQADETAILEAQKAELIANAAQRQGGIEKIKTEIEALDKLILTSKAETEQSVQAQAAARAEVASRQLASAALLDNSSRVEAYAKAVKDTQAEIDRLTVVEGAGIDVTKQLAEARTQNKTALYMERDAIKDLAANIDLETRAKSASMQLSIAETTASQNHYTAMAAEARASGDITKAVGFEIKAKEESIRVLRLKLQLDQLQQQSDLLIIDNKRKLINADTDEGKQKLKLIDIETQMVKIKAAGNQAILDQIKAIESETKRMRDLGAQTDSTGKTIISAMGGGKQAMDAFTGSVNNSTSAIEQQAEAMRKLQAINAKYAPPVSNRNKISAENPYGLTSDGLKANQDGSAAGMFGSMLPIDLAYKVTQGVNTGQKINMTQAEREEASKQAKNALTFLQEMSKLSAGSVSVQALQDAQAMVNATASGGNGGGTAITQSTPTQPSSTPAKTYTVNVNLGGTNTAINTSSDADAQALISVLQRAKLSA